MLLFTPELCGARDPLRALDDALDAVDVVQIRPKPAGSAAPCAAREAHEWCRRVLDLLEGRRDLDVLVIVDDRVDVAGAMSARGCAGVHLGQDDAPVRVAREFLGPGPLIGLSTHDVRQVAEASGMDVDYLGFGPIHATSTKGYRQGLGPEVAWVASEGSAVPLFAIGGIDATNAGDLRQVGRVAVGSAILAAPDPGQAAREIRASIGA